MSCCDLLENNYLCSISNNENETHWPHNQVVICLKTTTFAVSATTWMSTPHLLHVLWFAWKQLPLQYQQQQTRPLSEFQRCCDLLENNYLCSISNNSSHKLLLCGAVVICLKTTTFAVSATTNGPDISSGKQLWFAWKQLPLQYQQQLAGWRACRSTVVICLKTTTFAVSATTPGKNLEAWKLLWFAWKQLPLQYQQQLYPGRTNCNGCCDLLENNYLCSISNNEFIAPPTALLLWFAWKQLPLQYQQQLIIYIILITNTIYRYCKNKKVILQNKIPLAKGGIFVFYQLKIRTVPAADREH